MKDYIIRPEETKDYREVEELIRESFWNVYRPGCSEHYVIHVLRDDPAFVKELDFVMEQDGRLIGQNIADLSVYIGSGFYKQLLKLFNRNSMIGCMNSVYSALSC